MKRFLPENLDDSRTTIALIVGAVAAIGLSWYLIKESN
jgi:uncharacterized membrane-anchored protein